MDIDVNEKNEEQTIRLCALRNFTPCIGKNCDWCYCENCATGLNCICSVYGFIIID